MELLDAFDAAFAEWDRLVHEATPAAFTNSTPCTAWDVRQLVNHLVGEHLWAPHLLRGETLDQVGDRYDGDVVGDDPVAAWERAAEPSRAAFHRDGALDQQVHVTGGRAPAREYAWQMTTDLAVHGWDLARGLRVRSRMSPELAKTVYERVAPHAAAWQDYDIVAPPVPVADDAAPQDRLVALMGRRP